jgi:hypothetical protein
MLAILQDAITDAVPLLSWSLVLQPVLYIVQALRASLQFFLSYRLPLKSVTTIVASGFSLRALCELADDF